MEKNRHKLGLIVPYRNRPSQLIEFKKIIKDYLTTQNVEYELIIVEQTPHKTFNRGKLLNIGFNVAKQLNCDYVIFHDVDMLPVNVDYSYSDIPLHLATNFLPKSINRMIFDEYFGGVTLFPVNLFEKINGYSNEYWGWGYEDNDLLHRCKLNRIDLDKKEMKMMGGNTAALKFNGASTYIKSKNMVQLDKPITFFFSFYPDDIFCDIMKYDDTYTIFSIPNFDLTVSYNSHQRYNFVIYGEDRELLYINSDIRPNYKTTICVTIDPIEKIITMYQDGILSGEIPYTEKIFSKNIDNFMYFGVEDPNTLKDKKHYRGLINSIAIFDKILLEREIVTVSNNEFFGLTSNFGKYKSSDSLIVYYDGKFIKNDKLIDLSGNENNGEIIDCDIVGYTFDHIKTISLPYRRNSTFKLLPHDENGYVNGGWKYQTTRYNQIRYYNEVVGGNKNPHDNGLSTCEYEEISNKKNNNENHILVSI